MSCLLCGTSEASCSCDAAYDLVAERYQMARLIDLGPAVFAGELLKALRDNGIALVSTTRRP